MWICVFSVPSASDSASTSIKTAPKKEKKIKIRNNDISHFAVNIGPDMQLSSI